MLHNKTDPPFFCEGSVLLYHKLKRKVFFEHLLHSAVHYAQGIYRSLLFVLGSVYRLFHKSALFKAGIVMNREIVLEQEAAVADISHFTYKAEFLTYCINGNAPEALYRLNKRFSLVLGREHYCRADICALVFGSAGVAVRAADNGIFESACSVLIISHGLIAVLFKISLAAEHFKGIENLIFDEPVIHVGCGNIPSPPAFLISS